MARNVEENEKVNSEKSQEIRTATRTSLFQRLAARFGFAVTSDKKDDKKDKNFTKGKSIKSSYRLIKKPTESQLLNKSPKEELELINKLTLDSKLSTTVQDLFDDWAEDTQNTYRNIQEREERINALTYMCDNEGIVKTAVTLVASETASLSDSCAFTVISENKKWQDEINYTIEKIWKYDQPTIYSLAWNIFLYGEAFQGREVTSAGIVGINHVNVNEIAERLEFKPSKIAEFKMQMQAGSGGQSTGFTANLTMPTNGGFGSSNLNFNFSNRQISYISTDNLLKDYIERLAEVSSLEYFTSHLLGYRVYGDQLIAPWQISHFRFNAGVSEFWPYGQPPLLACLSAYKQLQRVMGLDDLEKLLSLPIHLYKVKTNGATVGRAFDIVNTVKERFENVGLISGAAGLEGPSLATNIWTSDDLVSIETVETNKVSDSGATDKMQFFNSRLSTATGIPMSYIDPSAEGFQMSGAALSTLFKPFRTLIENIRGIIMAEVEDTIRLHDSIRGVETPDFTISMNVVNPVDTNDTQSKFSLAEEAMDKIAALLGVSADELPRSIKRDIMLRYADVPSAEIENYEKLFEIDGIEKSKISDEELNSGFGDSAPSEDFGEEDTGADEDMGADEGMEESINNNTQRRKKLLQERYNLLKNRANITYSLAEKLHNFSTGKSITVFNENCHSNHYTEMASFMKQRFSRKHGKKRLKD